MSSILFQVPQVKVSLPDRPKVCPYCVGTTFRRRGGVARPVQDPHVREVWVYRYRCCHCKHTFRHYPQEVARANQTQRLRTLAAMAWILGMSYRNLVAYLAALDTQIRRMSAWRDVQEQAEALH